MRPREFARETAVAAWAQKVPSTAIALVTAIICLASLLTVGRAAAADAQLNDRLEQAGSRAFSVVDTQDLNFLNSDVVAAINGLSSVERAYGFSIAEDVTNTAIGPGGLPTPARYISGDLHAAVHLTAGRWPNPGEAIITDHAQHRLNMEAPFGSVTFTTSGADIPIVGKYSPTAQIDGVDSILVRAEPTQSVQVLQAIVTDYSRVDGAMQAARSIVGAKNPDLIRYQSPSSITDLAQSVSGDLATYSTSILYGVLGIGALICILVVFSDALARRSDLGRRMALGATRAIIIGHTIGRTTIPAFIGVTIGSIAGITATTALGHPAPLTFTTGVAILTLIVAAASAIPGALWAASRDPVAVLRIP